MQAMLKYRWGGNLNILAQRTDWAGHLNIQMGWTLNIRPFQVIHIGTHEVMGFKVPRCSAALTISDE